MWQSIQFEGRQVRWYNGKKRDDVYNVTDFFQLNWLILYFVYGQVFFVILLLVPIWNSAESG
jgi:hypothetical protein